MEVSFRQKMERLARSKKAKEVEIQQSGLQAALNIHRTVDESKKLFGKIAENVIRPMVKELETVFVNNGDSFVFYTDQDASTLNAQIRTFAQIFYFPKNRPMDKVGLNTASILFECLPAKALVQISSNTELRPSYLKKLQTVSLSEFNKELIEGLVTDFVSSLPS